MNRKVLGVILLASCMSGFFGCSEHSSTGPNDVTTLNPEAGRFGLSSMGKLEKRSVAAAVQTGSNVKFNLGKIKGSSGFFFLLYNVGMTPITSVSLNVNNPAFSVFPSTMDTLIPGSDVGMLPVIKIAAFHGTPYDGVGNRPLLPKGQNKFTLHISGNSKTASGADTVITLDAEMDLEALVMDLSIEGAYGQLVPKGGGDNPSLSNIETGLTSLTNYTTNCIGDSNIIIRNTGNVPLHCVIYHGQSLAIGSQALIDTLTDSVINSGNSISLRLTSNNMQNTSYYLVVSGDNAVADPSKLLLSDNGKFCAQILMGYLNCPDAQVINRFNDYLTAHQNDNCAKIWALIDNSVMVYGQNYNNGDSVVFVLYDLVNNTQLSSYTGTLSALVQDNCYSGLYKADFTSVIHGMLTSSSMEDKALGLSPGRISSGGRSNWVVTTATGLGLESCSSGK